MSVKTRASLMKRSAVSAPRTDRAHRTQAWWPVWWSSCGLKPRLSRLAPCNFKKSWRSMRTLFAPSSGRTFRNLCARLCTICTAQSTWLSVSACKWRRASKMWRRAAIWKSTSASRSSTGCRTNWTMTWKSSKKNSNKLAKSWRRRLTFVGRTA